MDALRGPLRFVFSGAGVSVWFRLAMTDMWGDLEPRVPRNDGFPGRPGPAAE